MVLEGVGVKGTLKVEFDYKYTVNKNLSKAKMLGGNHQGRRAVIIGESVLRETELNREYRLQAENGVLGGEEEGKKKQG